jgi:hypothetical protein
MNLPNVPANLTHKKYPCKGKVGKTRVEVKIVEKNDPSRLSTCGGDSWYKGEPLSKVWKRYGKKEEIIVEEPMRGDKHVIATKDWLNLDPDEYFIIFTYVWKPDDPKDLDW